MVFSRKCIVQLNTLALVTAFACSSDADPRKVVTAAEGLFINEISASNEDWIELYNNADQPKNIGGYFIYDNETAKYTLPAGTQIAAKGFLILFCDDQATGLHTNFKLSSAGETVFLENAQGELADYVEFPKLDNGQSYGRYPDGSDTFAVSGLTSQGVSNDAANAPAITSVSRVPLVPALGQSVTIQAELANIAQLSSVKLFYRFNGGAYTEVNMTLGGAFYNGTIPSQSITGKMEYYVQAKSSTGTTSNKPFDAPSDAYEYLLNTDPLPQLYINEFMASNKTCCPDMDGSVQEFDDWIEIYNAGSTAIDVGGMYLSDDKTNPFNVKIPEDDPTATTIPAGGFLLFWADEQRGQGTRHLNFKLSADGEDVALFYIDGRKIHEKTYPAQNDNKSFGLTPNGGATWQVFNTPTPGSSNQ